MVKTGDIAIRFPLRAITDKSNKILFPDSMIDIRGNRIPKQSSKAFDAVTASFSSEYGGNFICHLSLRWPNTGQKQRTSSVPLLYIQCALEKFSRAFRMEGINTKHIPFNTLTSQLVKTWKFCSSPRP